MYPIGWWHTACVCPLTLQRTHGSFLKSQSRLAWPASPQHLQLRLLSVTGLRQWPGACPTMLHLLQTFRSLSHEQSSWLCFPPHLPHDAPAVCCCFALVRFAFTPSWFPDGMEAELEGDPLEFPFIKLNIICWNCLKSSHRCISLSSVAWCPDSVTQAASIASGGTGSPNLTAAIIPRESERAWRRLRCLADSGYEGMVPM